jgi:hypothetical protein
MRTAIPLTVLTTALVCSLATAPAHARARVFVASYGNDANPCTFGSPCKTFQQAVNVVDPGGEVTAIDSAGFGPINIFQAVTITSPDGVEAGIVPVSGGDAIDINAGPNDAVVLRGLTLDGTGGGNNGVIFNSGGSLTITNCVVQNFSFEGVGIVPTAGTLNFAILNTLLINNGGYGILYQAFDRTLSASGVLDHVVVMNNPIGISFRAEAAFVPVNVTVSESAIAHNGLGIQTEATTNPVAIEVRNSSIVNNTSVALFAQGSGAVIRVTHSAITGNNSSVSVALSGLVVSYGDNAIDDNATNSLPPQIPLH